MGVNKNLFKFQFSKTKLEAEMFLRNTLHIQNVNYDDIDITIANELNKYFTRKCFSGNNLFASSNDPKPTVVCNASVENINYTVTLKKVGQMEMKEITDFEGENQRKKSFLEKVIKDILLKNKNTVKFYEYLYKQI